MQSNANPMPQLSLQTPQNPNIPPTTQNPQVQAATQQKEFNSLTLCRIGQETVADILSRFQDIFGSLKTCVPPNGLVNPQVSFEKRQKIQDQFRTIRLLFKRLRLLYDKCEQSEEYGEKSLESLIPYVDDIDASSDQNVPIHSEEYQKALIENKMLQEQIILKNAHLKEIIDNMRTIIWEINSMIAARKS